MQIAKVPANRIVIIGHSLGTAVTAGVVEHFVERGTDFAGVVLVSGFTDVPTLLESYAIGGYLPLLSPLSKLPALQKLLINYVVDKWPTAERLVNIVRRSTRLRLFIIHSKDDFEIPWKHSEALFAVAATATTDGGMDLPLLQKMKARSTIDMGDGAFISTWNAGGDKIIREEIVAYGCKSPATSIAPDSNIFQITAEY